MDIAKRVPRVVYADPLGVFPEFHRELEAHLPLTNLHWNPGDRPLRTIASLDIEFVPMDHERPQHQLIGLSDEPLVRVLFLEADNIDVYRGKLRKLAADWRNQVTSLRDPTAWLVVHYVGKGKPRSKSVWSKINSDFEGHTAQILMDDQSEPALNEMWARFLAALKQQVLQAFGQRVVAYEEEIRKLQLTRGIVGWNFGTLFCMKESLAGSFEKMNFLDDSFQIYRELEQLVDNDVFDANAIGDLSQSILQADREALSTEMLTQRAARFDFYRYLYTRQLLILLYQSQSSSTKSIAEQHVMLAMRHAREFLPKLVGILTSQGAPRRKIIEWQYRAAEDVFKVADEFGNQAAMGTCGEILLLQRGALQALADLQNYEIPGIFTEISLKNDQPLTAAELEALPGSLAALGTRDEYVTEYLKLTEAAMKIFKTTDMPRSVANLSTQIASVEYYHFKNYERTIELLENLPTLYSRAGWPDLSADLHQMFIECASKLNMKGTVVELCWSMLYLRPSLSAAQNQLCLSHIKEDAAVRPTQSPAAHWLDISVVPYLEANGRYYLNVNVKTKDGLPLLDFDNAVLTATPVVEGPAPERNVVFTSTKGLDQDCIKLYTNTFIQGKIKINSLKLSQQKQSLVHTFTDLFVYMQPLTTAINAQLGLSKTYTTAKRSLELSISSPKPIDIKVKFLAVDNLQLLFDKNTNTGLSQVTSATVSVPALLSYEKPQATVRVIIEYSNGGYYEFSKTLDLTSPVGVQVGEHFRPDSIISRFEIGCITGDPLVLEDVNLSSSREFDVGKASYFGTYTVLKDSPVSQVFTLKKAQNTGQSANMTLEVVYHEAKGECEQLMFEKLELGDNLDKYELLVKETLSKIPVDVILYLFENKFKIDQQDLQDAIETTLDHIYPADMEAIKELMRTSLVSIDRDPERLFPDLNVTMQVQVPQPELSVAHFVTFTVEEPEQGYIVGEPIQAKLNIEPCFEWAKGPLDKSTYFSYGIWDIDDNWSFSGVLAGRFTDKLSVPLSFVPFKSGSLSLPGVEITSNNRNISMEVVLCHSSEALTVVPEQNRLAITF